MRWIRPLTCPSQAITLEATCGYSTEVPLDQEVWLVHFGKDGPGFHTQRHRAFTLQEQICLSSFDARYYDIAEPMLYGPPSNSDEWEYIPY